MNINKSLMTLGNVINSLVKKMEDPEKKMHVPYRDSKLTRLVQHSLGGFCKTYFIFTVSPCGHNYDETLSTLRYADRARKFMCDPKIVNKERHTSINWSLLPDFPDDIKVQLPEKLEENPEIIQSEQDELSN